MNNDNKDLTSLYFDKQTRKQLDKTHIKQLVSLTIN